ncbi:hypothetical protein IKB17_04470 [bacterium]|nr:hypothetical protein [bacterium]
MKEIKNFKELKEKISFGELPYELMKDIVYQVYLFETEFDPTQIYSQSNKVVLLDEDEKYETPNLICEIEEEIAGYTKQVYILSDYGEGLIVYRKNKC